MSNHHNPLALLRRLFRKEPLEKDELRELYDGFNNNRSVEKLDELLDREWQAGNFEMTGLLSPETTLRQLAEQTYKQATPHTNRLLRIYRATAVAAAGLLLLALAGAGYLYHQKVENEQSGYLSELTAPNGQIRVVKLADGSKVWLNPGSTLIVPTNLDQTDIRRVRLWGQAFFEVAKDAEHPFVLEMGDIGLKVIGTSFNASNYKEDPTIDVVLKEGKVTLFQGTYESAEQFSELNPGEMARFTKGQSGFAIRQANIAQMTSWIDGKLIFRDERMANVLHQLERWYQVKIIVDDPQINDYLFTATIRTESLQKILELIEFTSQVDCQYLENNGFQAYKPTILIKNNTK